MNGLLCLLSRSRGFSRQLTTLVLRNASSWPSPFYPNVRLQVLFLAEDRSELNTDPSAPSVSSQFYPLISRMFGFATWPWYICLQLASAATTQVFQTQHPSGLGEGELSLGKGAELGRFCGVFSLIWFNGSWLAESTIKMNLQTSEASCHLLSHHVVI